MSQPARRRRPSAPPAAHRRRHLRLKYRGQCAQRRRELADVARAAPPTRRAPPGGANGGTGTCRAAGPSTLCDVATDPVPLPKNPATRIQQWRPKAALPAQPGASAKGAALPPTPAPFCRFCSRSPSFPAPHRVCCVCVSLSLSLSLSISLSLFLSLERTSYPLEHTRFL